MCGTLLSLHALLLVAAAAPGATVAIETVVIPGTDYEIGGPTYPYEIGKYEITNAQYCAFLNDAELIQRTDPSDPRCTNMWFFDTNGAYQGDVYMRDVTGYPYGSEWHARTLYKTTDVSDRSRIKYDDAQAYGSRFYVESGFDSHPVVTVSWYGAAKFCNWLTIDAGMDASEICYHEGAEPQDWYPITASDWSTNGLLDSERLDLVRNYRGFRLPMDGINSGGQGWNLDAEPYNEWYKAAAFDPAAPDTVRAGPGTGELIQPDHWTFGYGDDATSNAYANLNNSGDPFEAPGRGHSPVGWYDGVNLLSNGEPTRDTHNRYGLYDICGNVAEWMTDTVLNSPWNSTYRGARGGRHTVTNPKYATASWRSITAAQYASQNNTGLRVLRSPGYGDFDGDGDVDQDDHAFFADAMTGPVDTITLGYGYEACDYNGDDHADLSDFARFQQLFGATP